MWPSRGDTETVCCIACGERVARDDAREYDKHGDRWNRDGKEFEHLCKSCHGELTHAPREGLEDRLVSLGAGTVSRETLLAGYLAGDERDVVGDDER
jgi:hypothetical protein